MESAELSKFPYHTTLPIPESPFGDKSQVQKKFCHFMRHARYLLFAKITYTKIT